MFVEVVFDTPRVFVDAAALDAAFPGARSVLDAGAEVSLAGRVRMGRDVAFSGTCRLRDATVGAGCQLTDVALDAGANVRPYSILTDVTTGARAVIGPYAFLRDGVTAGHDCILGAHVEAARATFGDRVKISHRAFVGDATIGDDVILGAGTTFCNFDGAGRQATVVERGVNVGSGSLLVAPLTVGEGAVIGAGSTLTRDVPAGARVIQKRTPAT